MRAPRTREQMQAKVWAIMARAKAEGCGFLPCPIRSLNIDAAFLRKLTRHAGGRPTVYVLSHVDQRVYRVFASDLAARELPQDVLRALDTLDPKRSALLVLDVAHEGPGREESHFAKLLYLGRDGLVAEPLAIFAGS